MAGGMKRAYLAGPMRGYPQLNYPAFLDAARKLRAAGWHIWSPVEHNIENGIDDTQYAELRKALAADLSYICQHADAVIVLPGWQQSLGVNAEVAAARALGLPVHELHEAVNLA